MNKKDDSKRRFRKLVSDQFNSLGMHSCRSSERPYLKTNRRLRQYAELVYLATGCKQMSQLTKRDLRNAEKQIVVADFEKSIISYVIQLATDALSGKQSLPFGGVDSVRCVCGGHYHLDIATHTYQCSRCDIQGRADKYGFPISLPASEDVINGRGIIHNNIRRIINEGKISIDDAYSLVSYFGRIPEIYCHSGLLTDLESTKRMITATEHALDALGLKEASDVC